MKPKPNRLENCLASRGRARDESVLDVSALRTIRLGKRGEKKRVMIGNKGRGMRIRIVSGGPALPTGDWATGVRPVTAAPGECSQARKSTFMNSSEHSLATEAPDGEHTLSERPDTAGPTPYPTSRTHHPCVSPHTCPRP